MRYVGYIEREPASAFRTRRLAEKEPSLIDRPRRLEIAVTLTKQTTAFISNRIKNDPFQKSDFRFHRFLSEPGSPRLPEPMRNNRNLVSHSGSARWRAPLGPASVEPETARCSFHENIFESSIFETRRERIRVHQIDHVADVEQRHHPATSTVHTRKDCARFQHAPRLAKKFILQLGPRDVVQHRERHCAGKTLIGKRHLGRVALDHFHIRSPHSRAQRIGKPGSISSDVMRAIRSRRKSVVSPGPGPISSTFSPRSTPRSAQGITSLHSVPRQDFEAQSQ